MKASLYTPGEPAAGLHPWSTTIEIENLIIDDDEHRQAIRESLQALGETMVGERPIVLFDDECVSCGSIREDGAACCRRAFL